ncbi:MAG TPA: sugar transferase [Bryobacterales bacterium]|nr:sugar transferase [Bryobacterales bacterium]
MHQLRRNILLEGLVLFDMLAVAASLALGLFLSATRVHHAMFADFLSMRISLRNVLVVAAFLAASQAILRHCGLYRSRRLGPRRGLYIEIAQAVSLAALLLGALAVMFRIGAFDRSCLAVFWLAAAAGLAASRAALYRCLKILRRGGRNLRHIVIIGAGPRGQRFAQALASRAELGYRVLGFLDDGTAPAGGASLLGPIGELPRLLREGPVDEVAVALPIKTFYAEVFRIVSLCEEQGVVVRLPGDLFDARLARIESEQFEDLSVLTLFTVPGSARCFLIKRVADVILSAIMLLLAAPVMALIAVAIRLDSRGPALFSQLRVGHNGRRFRIWKFRTMAADAEARQPELEPLNEVRGATFKIRLDPRVTRVGRWLRSSSLDELPQLVNVLAGDMSLVGPRPLPLRDVARLREDWQRRRFSVRPGLTCLWQAGGRHALGFEDWMRLDLHYIDHWSLLLDLKILFRTLPAWWTGAGAS